MTSVETLVFDTGPLSHFAKLGWLGVLKAVVGERQALIPEVVADELRVGAALDPHLYAALAADWIERRSLAGAATAFAEFADLLVYNDRNWSEAAVLALAATTAGAVAILDDGAARKVTKDHGISLRPTLSLLCEAIRSDLLTVRLVSALVDDLLGSKYRLPFAPGGFEKWASDHNLI